MHLTLQISYHLTLQILYQMHIKLIRHIAVSRSKSEISLHRCFFVQNLPKNKIFHAFDCYSMFLITYVCAKEKEIMFSIEFNLCLNSLDEPSLNLKI